MDPNAIANPTNGNFLGENIPGGDIPFDDLFPAGEGSLTAGPTTVQPAETVPPKTEPQATQPEPFEVRTRTGSVYKSREDVVKGIEEKDTLLEKMRQELIFRTGVDPATGKRVDLSAREGSQSQTTNYLQDKRKYVKDLEEAVRKNDPDAYADTQLKLLSDMLEPLAPVITDLARQRAIEQVRGEVTEFDKFRSSDDYKTVLQHNKALGSAIESAENDFRMHSQLPELYRIAYFVSQGQKVPDLLKQAAQATQAVAAATTSPSRPSTMAPSTMAPPTTPASPADLSTSTGRQEIIRRFREGGGEALRW